MEITLTPDEMLDRWRLYRAMEPLRADCEVERLDGLDTDTILRIQMRAWYLDLLDFGDPARLAPVDVASRAMLQPENDGSAVITLPFDCRRLLELKVEGWHTPARITAPGTPLAIEQLNPYTRGNCHSPVAVVDRFRCRIYPLPSTGAGIEYALGAVAPADGSYSMDDSALNLIKPEL